MDGQTCLTQHTHTFAPLINRTWFPRQISSPEFCCPFHGLGVPPSPRAAPGPTFHPSWGGYSSLCVGMTWKDIVPRSHLPQKNMSSWNPGRTWCGPQGNSCRSPQEQVSRVNMKTETHGPTQGQQGGPPPSKAQDLKPWEGFSTGGFSPWLQDVSMSVSSTQVRSMLLI